MPLPHLPRTNVGTAAPPDKGSGTTHLSAECHGGARALWMSRISSTRFKELVGHPVVGDQRISISVIRRLRVL